jgi:protocatechuate 3,4-dioxygenase beta subunit
MRTIDENTVTDAVVEQMASTGNPRLRQIMAAAVRHLHAFAREVDLTPEEWLTGIAFLTAVGQKCSPIRQEFILLSDTLGLSSVVNSLNDKRVIRDNPPTSQDTKSSLLGPFYRQGAPELEYGQSVAAKTPGSEIAIYGHVQDATGDRIANATIQVWQTDEGGLYDTQRYDGSEMDMRGTFHTGTEGRYCLRTVRPLSYSIPMDGPVGEMIRAQRRHGMRPAHTHFLISAPGYRELVTALYMASDEYIDSDTVFGVTSSLVTEPRSGDASSPFPNLPSVRYDFVLAAAPKDAPSGRVGADPSQFIKQPVEAAH